jgi:hypothetical protein
MVSLTFVKREKNRAVLVSGYLNFPTFMNPLMNEKSKVDLG